MSQTKKSMCGKCGTVLVPAKEPLTFKSGLPLDGSWDLRGNICPKCHPERAQKS